MVFARKLVQVFTRQLSVFLCRTPGLIAPSQGIFVFIPTVDETKNGYVADKWFSSGTCFQRNHEPLKMVDC